jgi:hypothetical protein
MESIFTTLLLFTSTFLPMTTVFMELQRLFVVLTSVGLMKCLDDVSEDNIRNWFNSNLFLEGGVVQDEDARALISGRQSKRSELHDACIVAYENWAGIEEDVSPEERRLSSALDGVYYAEN